MRLEISRWNPFRFIRKGRAGNGGDGATRPSADPAGMEVLNDPFELDRWFGDYSPAAFQPRVDVVDEGNALRISADLPGIDRKDVEVLIEDGFLVLRGEKKHEARSEEKGCYRVERAFGAFQRVLPLPEDVDVERAEAKFDKGVLTLRLPKTSRPGADARRIEVK
jgi:HSP20 family protein